MTLFGLWHEGWTAAVVNHLWQSTAVVVIAWLLAAALRKNHARVRYWVWFAASVKFLLPFSLLIAAGEWLRSLVPVPAGQPTVASVMEQVTQPFGQTQFFDAGSAPIAAAHHASYWPLVLVMVWLCGALAIAIRFGLAWAKMNAVKRRARPFALAADVPVLSSSAPIEPGIFGVFRPVLLLPEGIPERLPAEQMRAIVAHEMCHVRRRDNLTFAIHMVVETLFWFHPLVWWIGSRLIEERERACDQAVVQAGSEAQVYAEGILNVCKFYVETPLNCVSGVTGADLKKRIARIMTEKVARRLSLGRILLLGAAAALALTMPVVLGVVRAETLSPESKTNARPSFEVATIKPVDPHASRIKVGVDVDPGGTVRLNGLPLKAMIEVAFDASYWQIEGGEKGADAWMEKERYNVVAKPPEAYRKTMPDTRHTLFTIKDERLRQMLQTLLIERFQLKVHRETSTGKVYLLERSGKTLRLKPTEAAAVKASPYGNLGETSWVEGWGLYNETMPELANFASGYEMHRPVLDRTGLTGAFNYRSAHEDWSTYQADPDGSFLRLISELGLKLVPATGPVEMLVIDHAERPSPN
jgi:uncharacterized protein (TIGR03435 family)